jgi:hypothetical protein
MSTFEISYFSHLMALPRPMGIGRADVRCAICGDRCAVRSRESVVDGGVRYDRMTWDARASWMSATFDESVERLGQKSEPASDRSNRQSAGRWRPGLSPP